MASLLKNPAVGELKSHLPGDVAGALDSLEALNPEAILKKVSEFLNHPIRSIWPELRPSLIPFFLSTVGSLLAGFLLNWSIGWPIFDSLPQLTILLFPFIGTVTNIMSTLSVRMKALDNEETDLKHFLLGNLKAVQCQAMLTSVFASTTSILASTAKESTRSKINLKNSLILSAASLVASVVANTILMTLLGLMIFISRRFQFKMDSNAIFTTVSSLRDIVAITLIALVTSSLQSLDNEIILWALLSPLLLTPIIMFFARRNPQTQSVIFGAFPALFGAILLEVPGGVIVQSVFTQHPVAAAMQPLFNGIARNLVGLHYHLMHFLKTEIEKIKMPDFLSAFLRPLVANYINSKISTFLMQILVPTHIVALGLILLGQLQLPYSLIPTLPFATCYLVAVLIQLFILLHLSEAAIFASKKYGFNADHSAMPMLTSVTNLLGTCAMAAVFAILSAVNDPNASAAIEAGHNGTAATTS